ncbi:MAG TPA: hypothetical protein VFD92_20210 [Candidatus Binatia bacterium]|nr:hypothetical protein [Candidatus Binatia bacterium]
MTGDAFARALRSLETLDVPAACERRLLVAGVDVHVRVASHLGGVSLRALAHHASGPAASAAPPDLTIDILDREVPGNPLRDLPPAERPTHPAGDRVERWSYEGTAGRGLLHEGFRALFLWNRLHRRAAVWLGEADDLPYHLVALPLLPILSWVLSERGLAVVHAAAVATARGAVLVGGRSGTGKSTAALACLSAGIGFLGDDMCVIEPGVRPVVHSLFCSAKLDAPDTGRFPALSPALVSDSGACWEKAVYVFDRHLADRIVRSAPLSGVAIPRRGDAGVARLTARQAFLAMAPNTVFQLPGAAQAAAAGVKEIVSRVPVHAVGVGDAIAEIPARLGAYARALSSDAARAESAA